MEACSITRRNDFAGANNIEIAIGTDRCAFVHIERRKKLWNGQKPKLVQANPFPNCPDLSKRFVKTENGLPPKTIGWGPFKSDWYSICSIHGHPKDGCNMCMTGSYCNRLLNKVGHFFHKHAYPLWFMWANKTFKWRRKDE
jgi:hypothetical protein